MFQFLPVRFRMVLPAALLVILLAACAPSPTSVPIPPTQTSAPPAPTETVQPEVTIIPAVTGDATYTIELNGVAQSTAAETMPAVPQSEAVMWWNVMPQYQSVTLDGYPISNHERKPQIFIFPARDLSTWSKLTTKLMDDLSTLLKTQQVSDKLPVLPLAGEVQVMHAQVKFLDFKNGQGVRFLTQYNSGIVPVNNSQLFYSFQGLTSDGKYYVAAALPVTFPGLPADSLLMVPTSDPFWTDMPGYKANTVKAFDEAATSVFTPDLAKLDAMLMSLEVK